MGLITALGLKPKRQTVAAGEDASSDQPPPPGGPAQEGGIGAAAPPVDKNLAAYQIARAAMQKLVDALNGHAQKARIVTQIAQAVATLATADAHVAKKEYAEAGKLLVAVKALCAAALKLAADWATYIARRTDALALAMSFDSPDNPGIMAWANPIITKANALANTIPPNFAAATLELKKIDDGIKPFVKQLITTVKARLATVEKSDQKARDFAKVDIDEGKAFIAQADKAFAASEWSLCRQTSISALRVLGPAVRMCERRGKYEKQRVVTVTAIAPVRAAAAVKDRAAALDAQVAQADKLAAYDSRKFEEGVRVLEAAAKRAALWLGLAGTVAGHQTERAAADKELAALDAHAAAAKITAEREAIRKGLADAKTSAASADAAPDPAAGWNAALTTVKRARADLVVAKKLADGLGPASAAEAAAAQPGNAAGMKTALDQLRADAKLAAKAPHAALAAAEFKRFDDRAAAAAAALAGPDPAKAAPALAEAAGALSAAKSIQAEHAQFATTLVSVEAQLKALNASPRAAAIKGRIDGVATALADAKAKDAAHDGPKAMAALRQASDAAAAAKTADHDRAAFDTDAAALGKRIAATKDAAEKAALDKMQVDATKQADAFAFADAGKALKKVEVRLDKAQLEAMMKAKPDDPKIAGMAAKMVANGGEATVDQMIQAVPNGGDARLVNALAQGRYGVKFTTGTPLAAGGGGDEAKAMKAVCAMFATIPQDVRNNKSIQGVSHEDAFGSAGGSHSYDDAKIRMKGRPGAFNQLFGAAQTNWDKKIGANVPELPAGIEPACTPANATPVDYLGFAAAHEVGHGVDDAHGFMKRNGSGEKYGGWITYGGSVQPVADAIGADPRYADFYKTPEQRQYILDTLMRKPATAPAALPGSNEDKARRAFDQWYLIATATDVYRRQGDCDAIKLGDRIFHEAYARTWVSYLAAARKRALTGYQFRAPGEWFAELYAGYRSGKLRPEHPAMEWLKKL